MNAKMILPMAMVGGLAAGGIWAVLPASLAANPRVEQLARASVYYAGCNEVRALGKAPLYRGRPGYRPEMDGDSDGIACEPYRGAAGNDRLLRDTARFSRRARGH